MHLHLKSQEFTENCAIRTCLVCGSSVVMREFRLVRADRKGTVSQIKILYYCGEQKNILGCTTCQALR